MLRQRLLLTLLFLGAVGLHRTWELRSYTGDGLALLTGRRRAYGYRYTEAFLSQVAQAGGDERLTDALARWTTQVWHAGDEVSEQPRSLTCYVDGHRKPVYTDLLIPRGLVGRLSRILGCRALVLLHDAQGHPLLVTTHRGDQQGFTVTQNHASRRRPLPVLDSEVEGDPAVEGRQQGVRSSTTTNCSSQMRMRRETLIIFSR